MATVGDDAPDMRGGGDVDAGWVVYKSKLIEVLGLEKVALFGGENAEAPPDAVFGKTGRPCRSAWQSAFTEVGKDRSLLGEQQKEQEAYR
ncbi:hypothetical protein CEP54_007111 [Fusarium duplospermum]|uniref:Uncharacterized protein n=1 Tax=Fusarium duplospermum TaxID=1325734 RepID=A0A428Q3K2_9HYPO|nr:hypothetical protein CEP54_007111 [Fusarium duplospermum]